MFRASYMGERAVSIVSSRGGGEISFGHLDFGYGEASINDKITSKC